MDAQGTCYQGYHFRHGGSPSSGETELQYVFFRLTPDEDTLQTLQVTDGAWGGNVSSGDLAYVPAGNGMSGRLLIDANIDYRLLAAVFSDPAGETSDGQLLWTPVP